MKLKKNIANLIIVILSGTFLVLLFLFVKQKEISFSENQRKYLFKNNILEIVLKTNIRYENAKLNDVSLLNTNNQSLYLNTILDTIPSLFLYVPLAGCDKCVEDIFDLIKKEVSLNKKNIKVCLLVKSPNFRSFLANQFEIGTNIEAYYIDKGWLGLEIEHLDTPFLFMADQSFRANCFFLVDKNLPEINEYYLKKIFSTL